VVGLVVGFPLDVVFGRWLWELFARDLSVVVDTTVPALLLVVVAASALALGNLAAAIPGRMAAAARSCSGRSNRAGPAKETGRRLGPVPEPASGEAATSNWKANICSLRSPG
jgi:hypothetical protein